MQRRVACVALPEIRIELARERQSQRDGGALAGSAATAQAPLAVIVARPGAAVKTEREVLGNTRIDFVSRQAAALGVRAGQTVAAARARCAALRVLVVAEGAVSSALARIAEAALAFGPTTAFDVGQDAVWVDVTGCAPLHRGEDGLARLLAARVRELGHACRVAIADGPRLASAVARFSRRPDSEPVIVQRGKGAAAMRQLPVVALGVDEPLRLWLAELGLRTCGDLQRLPRASLCARLAGREVYAPRRGGRAALGAGVGARAHDVMKLLEGVDDAPLDAWRPSEVPEERVEFDWGVHSTDALGFVLKASCDRLAARLQGRAVAASRLEVVLALDRAFCDESTPNSHRTTLSMVVPSPLSRAADLFAIVRARLDSCTLTAPVLAVTLRAPELAPSSMRPLDLLAPEPKSDGVLPRLVAELMAEMGEECAGTLSLVDTWSPDERTRLVPFGAASKQQPPRARRSEATRGLVGSALEPSRIVPAEPLPREAVVGARHLARIEATDWWRRGGSRSGSGDRPIVVTRRDLLAAWFDDALCWLELRDSSVDPLLRGWID